MKRLLLATTCIALIAACSDKSGTEESSAGDTACIEPSNPFDDGGGHHAGFEWAQDNGHLCPGDGQPFDEGCEEYYNQRRRFEECEAAKRK